MNATKEKLIVLDKKTTGTTKSKTKAKPKPKRKAGAEKMREAADKIVGRDCKDLIEALSTNGQNGQMLSAKFLYGLAEKAEEAGEGKSAGTFRSMAQELADAPEWKGDSAAQSKDEEAGED